MVRPGLKTGHISHLAFGFKKLQLTKKQATHDVPVNLRIKRNMLVSLAIGQLSVLTACRAGILQQKCSR